MIIVRNIFHETSLKVGGFLEDVCFRGEGKPENPEKNLSEQRKEPTTNSSHLWPRISEPNHGHIGGRLVLSTLRHPTVTERIFERGK